MDPIIWMAALAVADGSSLAPHAIPISEAALTIAQWIKLGAATTVATTAVAGVLGGLAWILKIKPAMDERFATRDEMARLSEALKTHSEEMETHRAALAEVTAVSRELYGRIDTLTQVLPDHLRKRRRTGGSQ